MSEHWLTPRSLKSFSHHVQAQKMPGLRVRSRTAATQFAIRIMSSRTAVWRNAVAVSLNPRPYLPTACYYTNPILVRSVGSAARFPFRSWIIASNGYCATHCVIKHLMRLPTWLCHSEKKGNEKLCCEGTELLCAKQTDCWGFHVWTKCTEASHKGPKMCKIGGGHWPVWPPSDGERVLRLTWAQP